MTLFAWLLATGSHWDLVQTYAWGSMIAGYAQEMSFSAAVKKTFSAESMCHLCHAVAEAKKSTAGDATTPGAKDLGKILLVYVPVTPSFFAPTATGEGLRARSPVPFSAGRAAPPSPPPRFVA
ncbi:MAG: hypothetical protein ABIZ04_19270 [Opitutus sp.]